MSDSARVQRDSDMISVRVPRGTGRKLDRLVEARGAMTRSEMVRALLDRGFDHYATEGVTGHGV
jgi:metal-responsive CopG/Arc/MetJ family transcriptional regulator